jgi:sorbitol-specific phosphotransferase system component IIA
MSSGKQFSRNVKSIGLTSWGFTADVNPILTQLTGSVTASGTTVTGNGTSFLTNLVVGDYINVGGSSYRVTAIASQNSLTIGTSLTATNSAYSYN